MTAAAEVLKNLPVGFRFHPTEVELVSHYLMKKIKGSDSHANGIIADIDILHYEPWHLPAKSLIKSDDEWFFFSRPERTTRNQIKRSTKEGYWKITGREHWIKAPGSGVVGKKRILTFYRRLNCSSQKTDWVIHEYYIPLNDPTAKQDIVLCRLIKKPDKKTGVATCDEGGPSNNASDVENALQPAHDMDIQMPPLENRDYFDMGRDGMLGSSHWNNDYNGLQSGVGDDEPIEGFPEYLESAINDPDQESCDELAHTVHCNDSIVSPALRVVCADGVRSDTDSDALPAQVNISPGSSRRDRDVMLHDRVQLLGGFLSEEGQSDSFNIFPSDSSDNDATPTFQINSVHVAFDEYYTNERGRRARSPLRSPRDAVKLPEKPKEPERPKPRPAVNLPKESITKFTKDKKVTQGEGSSFISWETIPLTSPRSVYLFNAVLGAILFVVFAISFIW